VIDIARNDTIKALNGDIYEITFVGASACNARLVATQTGTREFYFSDLVVCLPGPEDWVEIAENED